VKQKKNQLKTIRKQPMKINPRQRNKNRTIDVRVDQKRSLKNVVALKKDKIYFVANNIKNLNKLAYSYL